MSPTVGIDELKVGMFVHLDLGWWAHPFARSSFLITAADQIDTIRGLGLGRVRWSPEKSQLEGEGGGLLEPGATPRAGTLVDGVAPANRPALPAADGALPAGPPAVGLAAAVNPGSAAAASPGAAVGGVQRLATAATAGRTPAVLADAATAAVPGFQAVELAPGSGAALRAVPAPAAATGMAVRPGAAATRVPAAVPSPAEGAAGPAVAAGRPSAVDPGAAAHRSRPDGAEPDGPAGQPVRAAPALRAALSSPAATAPGHADETGHRADAAVQDAVGTRWAGATPFTASDAGPAGQPKAGPLGGPTAPAVATQPGSPHATALDPEAARALAHRQALSAQRQAERECLQQLSQARDQCQQLHQQLREAPKAAGERAEGLSRELVNRLLSTPDACMRTLADTSGEPLVAHALNVMVISLLVGQVCGLTPQPLVHLGQGALLHDIGKLDLPHGQRHAELALDAEAAQAYRNHVALGVAQGERMGLPAPVLQVLAQHHEMVDGSGFPAGCGRDEMAQAARIVALVNRYDNLCNPPELAKGITPHEALATLFAQSRGRFDLTVLNAFIRMMGVYPPGSMVQLTDERYAAVVKVNASRPLKPRVLVCDLGVPAEEAVLLDLDAQPQLGIRRSLRPAQLPPPVRDYLSPLPRMVYFFESASSPADTRLEAVAA